MSYRGKSPDFIRSRYTPQATAPLNPIEGDVYYDNGTNREEGLYQYKGNAWVLVGAGTNSQIRQFITNGDAETNITGGWATYVDAAAAQPVDGTGGVPANVTITTTATAPLRGLHSFLLTKDAANRQGQGWSYDFTIDQADKDKDISISADYIVNSGTFVSGSSSDITVWVYDVTNSTLITPTTTTLSTSSTTIADNFQATFRSSATSTSYRLIFHVSTVSANAYALKIDSVKVYPEQYNVVKVNSEAFTASGSFVVPKNVFAIATSLSSAGGGGGGGGKFNGGGAQNGGGGGGGAGGSSQTFILAVVPEETLTINVGVGGTAGAAGGPNNSGGSGGTGGNTEILRGSTVLARVLGAAGGNGGGLNSGGTGGGGVFTKLQTSYSGGTGASISTSAASNGESSTIATAGTGGPAIGTGVGCSGGGGGASDIANGGNGGNGGVGASPGTPGGNGSFGSGGGGGGGGDNDSGIASPGGAGGDGYAIISWSV